MFDLDPGKLLVFGIVALAVIPPKDLPRVLRTVGQYVGRMRRMAAEFQGQFMDAMKEAERAAELDSVKKEFSSIEEAARIDTSHDPVSAMRGELTNAIEPPKSIAPPPVAPEEEPLAQPSEPFPSDVVAKVPNFPEVPSPSEPSRAPSAAP